MDGSITIDTRIDQKGFKAGVKGIANAFKSLGNVIKGIGKALVGVFVGGAIINSIKGILGQFDFLKSSIGDKIKPLSDAWETLKGTFVNFIATALVPMIPYLVMAVQWFTKLLNTATMIIAALFGMKQTVGGIAAETKKTEKAAKGSLAAFDQISVLQQPEDTAGGDTPMITPESLAVTDDILAKVQTIRDILAEWFANPKEKLKELFDSLVEKFKDFIFWDNWVALFNGVVDWFKQKWQEFKDFIFLDNWGAWFAAVWENVKISALGAWQYIKDLFSGEISIFDVFLDYIEWAFGNLKKIISAIFDGIVAYIKWAWGNLVSIVKFVVDAIVSYFNWAWGNLKSGIEFIGAIFENVFNGVINFLRGAINIIIDIINNMLNAIINGINFVVSSVNAVGGLVPGFSPITEVSSIQIPKLATGAVIPPNAEFAAILGDQTRGRNIEAPEELIRQIIREEMAGASGDVTVPFTIELDGEVIYKSVKRASTRHGKSLIAGGTA